jgi:hypothetical protein
MLLGDAVNTGKYLTNSQQLNFQQSPFNAPALLNVIIVVKVRTRRRARVTPQVLFAERFKALLLSPVLVAALYALIPKGGTAEALRAAQTAQRSQSWTAAIAQVSPTVPLTQQGNQVTLNGLTRSIAWSQRQQQIGIADAGLFQAFGIDLLNTEDAARQPVQWFSQPATEPFVLDSWLTNQHRYLSISEFAQRQGWQIRTSGTTLQVTTPPCRVTGVRQGRQTWGDRLVLDLDRSTPWQITEQGSEFVVAVDAQIDPALVQNFVAAPGNRITSLRLETSGSQTLIRVGISSSLRPRVWTLPNPNRLVIDVRPDSIVERNIVWAPGVRWRQQVVRQGNSQFPVVSLTIDPRQPGVALKPIWNDPATAIGTAPLLSIAQRWQAAAAINGGFFNRNNQLPLGAIRQDNRWVSGPILNRGAIAWNERGEVAIGRLSLQESVLTATGQRFPVLSLNSGYVQAGVARYTIGWGATYTPILDNETLIVVQDDRVTGQRSGGAAGQTAVPIPANGYLLVVRSHQAAASALPAGTALTLEAATVPAAFNQFSQILGAGPLLIADRQIVLNAQSEQFSDAFIRQAAVRSAIGQTADGNLLLVTVHQRVGGLGPTLSEIAQMMQQLGAVNALNLDGGSSTTLYLGGQVLNRAPRTAARVHSGIGVFIQPASQP